MALSTPERVVYGVDLVPQSTWSGIANMAQDKVKFLTCDYFETANLDGILFDFAFDYTFLW